MTITGSSRRPGQTPSTSAVRQLVLLAFAFLSLFPPLLILSTAIRTPEDVRTAPFDLFTSFSVENIAAAWTRANFSEYFLNSVLLAVPSTVLVVVLATAAGYAFARCAFLGRDLLFYAMMLGLLVPFFTIMIPLYFQLRQLGLLDTLIGAILVLTMTQLAFGTFMMRSFFIDIPNEFEQAARVDGASEWQIFLHVMLPFVRSAAGALTVFAFLQNWNNFLVPLLYLPGGEYRPLTAGLYLLASGRTLDIGPLAAGSLLTVLPVIAVFLVAQRQLLRGFMAGAVKG
ncbi:MAG: ABC transporter permease subunit [Streptosporangiales bacterium]|nr:ABC transporter permease subunit [Streptosporangiales bacterium]